MENTQKPERDCALDVLRAVAALYIIGFWHHVDYIDLAALKTPFTKAWAVIALGLFFTVSSYLLTNQQKENILSCPVGKERTTIIHHFYLRRVFRIYPLYVIAVLLFFAFDIGRWSIPHLITSLTLVAAVIDKSPLTLWFINVIFIYYLALPFFWFYMRTIHKILIASTASFIVFFVMHRLTPMIDERIYVYLPSMIFGVLLAQNDLIKAFCKKKIALGISFVCLLLSFVFILFGYVSVENISFSLPILVFPILLFLSQKIANLKKLHPFWKNIGYASFAAYLFHRVLYMMFYYVFDLSGISGSQLALAMLSLTFIVFAVSYVIQRLYDVCARNLQGKYRKVELTS